MTQPADHLLEPEPSYRRIQSAIRARITEGEYPRGQALPSRRQLCEEFGTTRVTLDKAVLELVREGLLRSSRGSGTYVADPHSGSSPAGRALRIGIVLGRAATPHALNGPASENFYFGPLFQGMRDAFAGQRVETIYAHQDQTQYATFCTESVLDGLLLTTPLLEELASLHALTEAGVAFVAVGISSRSPASADLPFVDSDSRQGVRDAVGHLIDLGHRRIAMVNLATSQANHHDRLEGYLLALASAGVSVAPEDLLLYPIHDTAHLDERINDWLCGAQARGSLPSAILAADYLMTLATLRVLRRNGLRVPEDVSVVGFDDPFSAEHLTPPLTTVRQPVYQIGRRAAERLLESLRAGESPRGAEVLPTQLIVRESTGSPISTPATPERQRVSQ